MANEQTLYTILPHLSKYLSLIDIQTCLQVNKAIYKSNHELIYGILMEKDYGEYKIIKCNILTNNLKMNEI